MLRGTPVRVRRVDESGIALWGHGDRPIDVLIDGRRVWSFWLARDTDPVRGGFRSIGWPTPLLTFLDGRARICVREHVSGRVLFDEERSFGSGVGSIAVVGASGAPLGLDKSGRLSATFDSRSAEDVAPLLDAMSEVLALVEGQGLEPVIAYGTLLGAVREGRLLGHDSDADLAYVSHHSHPLDVARESFALQRAINEQGYATFRYSGAAFRVDVEEGDGVVRGLDVFAGFLDGALLYLMGEIGAPVSAEQIWPRSTVTLEGRSYPATADPEALLEPAYGPGWRVPDPAFHFETSTSTTHRLTGWFRSGAAEQRYWQRAFSQTRLELPRGGSQIARMLSKQAPPGSAVIDLGAGRAPDSLWLARRGLRVTAFDFVADASLAAVRQASAEDLDLTVRDLDLNSWRSVLAVGAELAHTPGPRSVLARHVADATSDFGRDALLRLTSMALRDGGRLYLQVWTGEGRRPPRLRPLPLDTMVAEIEQYGGRVVRAREIAAQGGKRERDHGVGQVVAEWT